MNNFLRDKLKNFSDSVYKLVPRKVALASGLLLLLSLCASHGAQAALSFGGGNVTVTSAYVCSGNSGTVTFSATSVTAGGSDWTATYAWESSPNNSTWTPIAGATGNISASSPNATYVTPVLTFAGPGCGAATYYRIVVSGITNNSTGAPGGSFTAPTSIAPVTLTVCANPSPITGANQVCQGSTITVADVTGGGTWSSSVTTVATIGTVISLGPLQGIITGVGPGTTTISYSIPPSGCAATSVVTVNPLPSVISGPTTVCVGSTITVFDTLTGGTWGNPSGTPHLTIGSIGLVGAVQAATVTGTSPGTNTIAYTSASGCTRSLTITVNGLPSIGGVFAVCQNSSTTLTGTPTGGTWLSTNTSVASIGSSNGVLFGEPAGSGGNSTISYTDLNGCVQTVTATVNQIPAPITGTYTVCVGGTTPLASTTGGGVWTSSNTTIATVGGINGIVSGNSAGVSGSTATITYMLAATSCYVTQAVTVMPLPGVVSGTLVLCEGGQTTTLTNAIAGGSWSSTNGTVATIGSSNGAVVSGIAGTTTIRYTLPTGCFTSAVMTVSALPTSITGTLTTCENSTTQLTGTPSGGIWTAVGFASVNPTTGVVTGGPGTGTAIISYTNSSNCSITTTVTVGPALGPITGTMATCTGNCTTLTPPTAGGTWASSNATIATVGTAGNVCGVSAGTVDITYTDPGGCFSIATVTVSAPPSSISGPTSVCINSTITLTGAGGGTWSANNANVTVGSLSGAVTGNAAGTSIITYSLTGVSGCFGTYIVTVNSAPSAFVFTPPSGTVCVGGTMTVTSTPAGGTWSTSTPGIATVNSTTGVITGVSCLANNGRGPITYTAPTGCRRVDTAIVACTPTIIGSLTTCVGTTTTLAGLPAGGGWSGSGGVIAFGSGIVVGVSTPGGTACYTSPNGCQACVNVTVNPLPGVITATSTHICAGNTTTLSNDTLGGTWSSSNTAVATVNASTGVVTGVNGGTATLSYIRSGTGCYSTIVITVDSLLPPITGNLNLCLGQSSTLSNATAGGSWDSDNTAVATINSSTGVVTGAGIGTATIDYSTPSGCLTSVIVTVNINPSAITGALSICVGSMGTLSSLPTGGTWSTTSTNFTVGSVSGIDSGAAAGTGTVTYTLPTGCSVTGVVTVNAPPAMPTGPTTVCTNDSIVLTASVPGLWSTTSTNITVNGTNGTVYGGTPAGPATVTFTDTATGCSVDYALTVNPIPNPINGPSSICLNDSALLSGSPTGGIWTSSPPFFVSINPITGMAHGVGVGVSVISYTLPTGCYVTASITVNPLPLTPTVNPICVGSSTTAVSSPSGGTWSNSTPGIASIDVNTGLVIGLSAGTTDVVTYTLPTGCYATTVHTVYALPTAITGDTAICHLSTGTLFSTPAGGTWTSGNTAILTINSTTGAINAVTAGTVTATYVDLNGCSVTKVITVNPLPPVMPNDSVCVGSCITLSNITTGGTWSSSSSAYATAGSATGIVCGIQSTTGIPGTPYVTITYTLPTGCIRTVNVTVNPVPSPIVGPSVMCHNSCITLSLSPSMTGGSWSSSSTAAVVTPPGGIAPGQAQICGNNPFPSLAPVSATISYTMGTGCYSTYDVTVNPLPSPIGGPLVVCVGATASLTNAISGGTWTATAGTGSGTITASTGIFTGVTAGTVNITYTLPTGCLITRVETVDPLPGAITGDSTVCEGSTITVSTTTTGGTWSIGPTSVATISSGGVITGVAAGTAIVTYTATGSGCIVTRVITVNPLPQPILGLATVCLGYSVTLSDADSLGTWSASPPGIVGITTISTSGNDSVLVTGTGVGNTIITYTLPTGCSATFSFTVHALPTPIQGVPVVCIGHTTTLWDTSSISNGTGTWTFTNLTGAIGLTPGPIIGGGTDSAYITGVNAGTAMVTYTEPTHGCYVTEVVTVNPNPTPIFGTTQVCVGYSSTLHDTTANGYWVTADPAIATVDTNGVVTGVTTGTVIISYVLNGTGCYATLIYTVNPLPTVSVTPPGLLCRKSSIGLLAVGAGFGGTYVWNPTADLSCSNCPNPIASPTINTTYTVTGTNSFGCSDTAVVTVFVDSFLNDIGITGRDSICAGTCDTLHAVGFHGSLFSWLPVTGLSCSVCDTVRVCPPSTTMYMAVAIDSFGCRDTARFTVTVMPLPRMSYEPNPLFVCKGSSTQVFLHDFTATTSYVTRFAWFPNIFTSCDTCPSPFLSDTFNLVHRVIGITPFGCYDSIKIPVSVLENSVNTISRDTFICEGQSVQLQSSSMNPDGSTSVFEWSPYETLSGRFIPNPIATPSVTTIYTLVVTPNVCFHDTETVTVVVSPYPKIQITPPSKNIIAGSVVPLTATIVNGVNVTSYFWAPAKTLSCEVCFNTIATPTVTTTYVFTATTNYGCTGSDSIRLSTSCDDAQVFIPNTFTPNGDGMNDRFFISGKGISKMTSMRVFNRWGELVFENYNFNANDPGAGWDGTYRGMVVPPDVFTYVVEGMCELGSPLKYIGDISIVR